MRVAVTGATGHLGANLVRLLVAEGYDVVSIVHNLVRETKALAGLPVEIRVADVHDKASLLDAFDGIEQVFHLAAIISTRGDPTGEVYKTNVLGVRNVVDAALACKVKRLVHVSSIHAFDLHPKNGVINEQGARSISDRHAAYDRSKALGEEEVRHAIARGLDAVIINPGGCVGPYDFKRSRMGQVLIDLYHNKVPAIIDGGFHWVDTRDVAEAILNASRHGRTGEQYLIIGHFLSMRQLMELAATITGARVPRMSVSIPLARLAVPFASFWGWLTRKEPLFTHEALDALTCRAEVRYDKAAQELGYDPRPFSETLRDTYKWHLEMGHIAKRNTWRLSETPSDASGQA